MAVNLRKKYYGKKEVSKKNRPYRFQLDYSHQGKRLRETIKDVEFLPILKANSPIDLNTLKTQSGLSNKKWDKTIKGLTKLGLAKVTKTDDALTVEVVE